MKITDEIRKYRFKNEISFANQKTSREYYALAVLKYAYPNLFSGLFKSERPDLQDSNGFLGIEVTYGGSQNDSLITGESNKYRRTDDLQKRSTSVDIIKKHGGYRNSIITDYPARSINCDLKHIQECFEKKNEKAVDYRKVCRYLGLAILIEIPFSFFDDFNWETLFTNNNYDFIVIIHLTGADMYCFKTKNYYNRSISKDDLNALKIIARMTAEKIINEYDPLWN